MEKDNHFLKNGLIFLSYQLIGLIDSGEKVSIDIIEKHISDENILNFLIDNYNEKADFSIFECGTYSIKDINHSFWDLSGYIDGNESRKYAVTNEENGLLLLISVCIDLINGLVKVKEN